MRIAPQIPIFRSNEMITLGAGLFHWGPENYTYVNIASKTVRLHLAPQTVGQLGVKAFFIAAPALSLIASIFVRSSFLGIALKIGALALSFIPLACLFQCRENFLNRRGVEFTVVDGNRTYF